ncbi:MAG TPA: hypothetical protein DIV41_04070, partial [Ruminococcaceae bacterium]|nr:hypothetical protein [Oscillospiraceae bacterium]
GFSYDYYITRSEYDSVDEDNRNLLLLKAVVLSDSDASKYKGILQHLDLGLQEYTKDVYYSDCLARKSESCSKFTRDNKGLQISLL